MGHRADRGILGDERRSRPRRRALDKLANGLIPKVLMGVGLGDGGEDALAWVASCQAEDALNEPNGADAADRERGLGPPLERRAHARTLAHQSIDVRLLTRRGLRLAGAGRKHAGRDPGVHHDERVAMEDAHEVGVPPYAEPLPEQRERHRVERPGDFDVAVGVDRRVVP